MDFPPKLKVRRIVFPVLILYIAWSIVFIFQSSAVAVDGNRYFSLFDDAMISMRYAWNLSHGHGLVWNPGERVEGYTNLLMTLFMSVFTGFFDKSEAVLAVQISGLFINLGIAAITWRFCHFFIGDFDGQAQSLFKTIILIMVVTYYPLSYWSLMGMETGLLTLIVLASLYVMELYLLTKRAGFLFVLAGLSGLAHLTRPDAIIFSLPIFLYIAYMNRLGFPKSRSRSAEVVYSMIVYALFIVGQEVFRIVYYNEYLPNTYYLKLIGMPLVDRIRNGLGFILPYILTHMALLGVSIAGGMIEPEPRKSFHLGLILLPVLYQVWVGGDPWPYWRIMTPLYPVLAITFVLSMHGILQGIRSRIPSRSGQRLRVYILAIGILLPNSVFAGELLFIREPYQTREYERLINTAIILDEITTEKAGVGVFWAGIIPYYSGRPAVDFLGRNDKYIARLQPDLSGMVSWSGMYSVPGHNKYDLDYSIKHLLPTYIQYPIWKGQNILSWAMDNYSVVNYKGIQLWLKKDAQEVKWGLLGQ